MTHRGYALRLQLLALPFGAAVWFLGQPWRGLCLAAFLFLFLVAQRMLHKR